MNDVFAVGFVERFGNLGRDGKGSVDWNGTAAQALGERFAFEELHDQEWHALFLADVVHGADVGMADARDGPRFPLEPFELLRRRASRRGEYFDGHRAVESRVAGTIDLTHPSSTEAGQNLVGADSRARGEGHW